MDYIFPKKQPPARSQIKRDLYRLMIARSDVGAAHTATELFLRTVNDLSDDLYYPLFMSIVVCYARPFTQNEPFGALPKKWSTFDNEKSQNLHDSLIKARHEVVAHSDMTVRKAFIYPPNVSSGNLNGRELRSAHIGTATSHYQFTIPMIRRIPGITVALSQRLQTEIDRLVNDLYGGMELPNAKFRLRIDEGL